MPCRSHLRYIIVCEGSKVSVPCPNLILINARFVLRLHARPSGMRRRAHLRRREKATEPRGAMAMAIAEPLDARSRTTALIMSTVALAACFMIWTVFSIIGVRIQRDFGQIGSSSCRERVWQNW